MGLKIRAMTAGDIPLGLELCRLAGWNQTHADWQRLLTLSPDSVFVAEYKDRPCATACATRYGTNTAWIGMVLVHPDFRRRNIGSSLMRHCIECLKTRRVASIKIDASDQGRPVYLRLGFDDERPICRYEGPRPAESRPHPECRAISDDLWPGIAACDVRAFGADRLKLLKLLSGHGPAVAIPGPQGVVGYGFARKGLHASFIGPVVALDIAAAQKIVSTLLSGLSEGNVHWDILPDNVAAKNLAAFLGFTVRRRFMRMCLGSPEHSGDLSLVYGTAGLELG